MTTDAVGFQAMQADREYLCLVCGGVGQIHEGLLIQREFLRIRFHFGSLIGSDRIQRPGRHFILLRTVLIIEGWTTQTDVHLLDSTS